MSDVLYPLSSEMITTHGALHQVITHDTRDGYSKETMFTPQTAMT